MIFSFGSNLNISIEFPCFSLLFINDRLNILNHLMFIFNFNSLTMENFNLSFFNVMFDPDFLSHEWSVGFRLSHDVLKTLFIHQLFLLFFFLSMHVLFSFWNLLSLFVNFLVFSFPKSDHFFMNLLCSCCVFFLKFCGSLLLLFDFFWCCLNEFLCKFHILLLLLKSFQNSRNISLCDLSPRFSDLILLKILLFLFSQRFNLISFHFHLSCDCLVGVLLLISWYLIRIKS